ncbi:MAG: Do family serine endopeptidase [Rhodobacteraceae bacterium]|nr:Do family serine endopeptidase [Paracoccaceae bacterium]
MLITAFSLILIIMPSPSLSRVAGDSLADLVEQISPAVVNIVTTVTLPGTTGQGPIVPEGSPLEDLFKDFQGDQQDRPRRRGSALGSGFIISADGLIVTNNHVIVDSDEILIEFFDGKSLIATVVGRDEKTDLAVLKVESEEPLPFVQFGDSDVSRVGDWVLAIGNPLGQGFSVSAGIISARNRSLNGSYDDFIQTDAAINRGNSGGPLFNMDGDVIGVNTAILSPTGGSVGIGFSMSSAVVSKVVGQLIEYGETRRGWLGVRIQDVSEDIAAALELEAAMGALVTDVMDGPAGDAGILPGDVITTFDGVEVESTNALVRMVGNADVGKAVRVVVVRDGKSQTFLVDLGRLEEALLTSLTQPMIDDAPEFDTNGLTLGALNAENLSQFGLGDYSEGVLIMDVDEGSVAFDKGLRAGDIITEIGQEAVTSPGDIDERIASAKAGGRTSILLLVHRDGDKRFVALSLVE